MRRRDILASLGTAALVRRSAVGADAPWLSPQLPDGTRALGRFATLPGKQQLIELSDRPPNYETPIGAFRTAITPNDQFFVRYHLSEIPGMDALREWKLSVGGDAAERTVTLNMDDLRGLPRHEVAAVCQCSGNRRGLFDPHVAGVEWGFGAMGCGLAWPEAPRRPGEGRREAIRRRNLA